MNDFVDDYLAEMLQRYPKENNVYDTADLKTFLLSLRIEDRPAVIDCIKRNHKFTTFPKLTAIKQYIAKDRISFKVRGDNSNRRYSYYVCMNCKTKFDHVMGFCPRCKKNTPVKSLLSKKIDNAYHGHEDCSLCIKYNPSLKSANCDRYGKGDYDYTCNDCICRVCCADHHSLFTNKKEYLNKVLGVV
jgi:hypothetical protein